jgi:hypothetical protein
MRHLLTAAVGYLSAVSGALRPPKVERGCDYPGLHNQSKAKKARAARKHAKLRRKQGRH